MSTCLQLCSACRYRVFPCKYFIPVTKLKLKVPNVDRNTLRMHKGTLSKSSISAGRFLSPICTINNQSAQNQSRTFCASIPDNSFSVTTTNLSKQLILRKVERESESNSEDKPLVILFDWLYAKTPAVNKYCDLYHQRGLDVLTVKGRLVHFLWPPRGAKLAEEILQCLETLDKASGDKNKYIVHAFSIGAYIYTICMLKSWNDPEKTPFRKKVVGQIFDSVVLGSYDNMSTGIGEALPGSSMMKRQLLGFMHMYYHLTKKKTKDEYDRLVSFFKENPIIVPTLIFYSNNDPMCDTVTMEKMIDTWKEELPNFDVTVKSWEESVHAAHLKFHNEDYMQEWNSFMAKLNLDKGSV